MDGRRQDALTDSALDRELEAALDVNPSPEFVARVRLRVAEETPRRAWPFRWQTLLAGAAAAAVAIAWTVSAWIAADRVEPRDPVMASVPVEEGAPKGRQETASVAASAAVEEVRPGRSRPGRQDVASRSARAGAAASIGARLDAAVEAPPFPEVLISPDEVRALEMLIAAVQAGRPLQWPAAAASLAAAVEVPDLEIAPLIIEPLPQIARLQPGETP